MTMANSPDPGVPQSPTKAVTAGLASGLMAFAMFYVGDDDPFTKKEIIQGLLLAVPASGLVAVPTYLARNKRTR